MQMFAHNSRYLFLIFITLFVLNVDQMTIFQTINAGNWVRVETIARQLAEQEQAKLHVYTGTYRQLSLISSGGDSVPLYLSNTQQIEVPEYLWKVVHHARRQSAIVFITLNNPFARRADVRELCPDVCTQAGIEFTQSARRGFTYCCSLNDFSRVISLPIRADHLLALNKK